MDLKTLKERRTIRKYSSKHIPDSLLKELLETAFRASTTGNMQLYSVIITRDDNLKKELAPAHFNQATVTDAPIVLTFCADFNRFIKWCECSNAQHGYNNFQSFYTASIDALIVAQQFCTAAEANGLGICYLGTTTYNADKIINILNLPKYVIPVTTITVGYPESLPPQVERLPLEAMIHNEKYQNYTTEDIEKYYKDKEELECNKKFVTENKKESLAQVFTDIRYPKSNNEHFSNVFIDVIKSQGFEF